MGDCGMKDKNQTVTVIDQWAIFSFRLLISATMATIGGKSSTIKKNQMKTSKREGKESMDGNQKC